MSTACHRLDKIYINALVNRFTCISPVEASKNSQHTDVRAVPGAASENTDSFYKQPRHAVSWHAHQRIIFSTSAPEYCSVDSSVAECFIRRRCNSSVVWSAVLTKPAKSYEVLGDTCKSAFSRAYKVAKITVRIRFTTIKRARLLAHLLSWNAWCGDRFNLSSKKKLNSRSPNRTKNGCTGEVGKEVCTVPACQLRAPMTPQ